ncbi:hypothetical protein [Streptomyces coriariae]|uniref:hypothetical protein n=1 Tax=Streptomyces coriariae TaxID=2864460 RepID=UPI003556685C
MSAHVIADDAEALAVATSLSEEFRAGASAIAGGLSGGGPAARRVRRGDRTVRPGRAGAQ